MADEPMDKPGPSPGPSEVASGHTRNELFFHGAAERMNRAHDHAARTFHEATDFAAQMHRQAMKSAAQIHENAAAMTSESFNRSLELERQQGRGVVEVDQQEAMDRRYLYGATQGTNVLDSGLVERVTQIAVAAAQRAVVEILRTPTPAQPTPPTPTG